jgi:anhydro-N-acetylmuramic acid kinase
LASKHIADFCQEHKLKPGFLASHGHTIFHQPNKKITLQIGDGAVMAANTGITVVCDFRSQDVELGGQGAPLVPIGDKLLFSDYKYCLNLGGFANISYDQNNERKAFDVCACNVVLNHLSKKAEMEYDIGGLMAKEGKIISDLLEKLNKLEYYSHPYPKSLGIEWAERSVFPLLKEHDIADLLRTYTEHIALQLSIITEDNGKGNILVTGGGAKNGFLIERINALGKSSCIIPEEKLIDYKEALVFALLGLLRIQGNVNVLASVTGSKYDHSSGCIYS